MSGLEGLGAAASVVTLIELTFYTLHRIKEYTDTARKVPSALRATVTTLPVIAKCLTRIKASHQTQGPQDPEFEEMIKSFHEEVIALDDLVKKIIPHREDHFFRCVRKAVRSMRADKHIEDARRGLDTWVGVLTLHLQHNQTQAGPMVQSALNTAARIRDRFFNCCRPKNDAALRDTCIMSDDFRRVKNALLFRPYMLCGTSVVSASRGTAFDGWMPLLVAHLAQQLQQNRDVEVVIWINQHTLPLLLKRLGVDLPHDDDARLKERKIWDALRTVLEEWGRTWLLVLDCRALDMSEAMRHVLVSLPRSKTGYVLALEARGYQVLPADCRLELTMRSTAPHSRLQRARDMLQSGVSNVTNFFSTRKLEDFFRVSRPSRDSSASEKNPDGTDARISLHARQPPAGLVRRAQTHAVPTTMPPSSRSSSFDFAYHAQQPQEPRSRLRSSQGLAERPYEWGGFEWKGAIV